MKLWVDGDSCPAEALAVVLNLHGKHGLAVEVVGDRTLSEVEKSPAVMRRVDHGTGRTDERIRTHSRPGDLALTRDLDLAKRLLGGGVTVINDRGRVWNLGELERRIRDAAVVQAMKAGGMMNKQGRSYGPPDAAILSRELNRILKSN